MLMNDRHTDRRRAPLLALMSLLAALICLPDAHFSWTGTPARAAAAGESHAFVLGFKDPELRTEEQLLAMERRLRARLLAAQILDHRIKVDRRDVEVRVDVTSTLSRKVLRELLTARGQMRIVAARPGPEAFEGLRASLPEKVAIGYRRTRGETDVFFYGEDRATLAEVARKISMWDQELLIGPPARDDQVKGWRTWLIAAEGAQLDARGLDAVKIVAGTHPNYHHIVAHWSRASSDDAHPVGQKALRQMTDADGSVHLLLVIDGRLEHIIQVGDVVLDGQLHILMPPGSDRDQFAAAQRWAALMAAPPHPCEIVVIRQGP